MSEGENEKSKGIFSINFKEVITGFLAVSIILYALLVLYFPLSKSPPDVANAESIFNLISAWVGVILGYYFGRVPAEKMAEEAKEAKEEVKETVKTKLEAYHKQLSDIDKMLSE
jgi:hypothetical protein